LLKKLFEKYKLKGTISDVFPAEGSSCAFALNRYAADKRQDKSKTRTRVINRGGTAYLQHTTSQDKFYKDANISEDSLRPYLETRQATGNRDKPSGDRTDRMAREDRSRMAARRERRDSMEGATVTKRPKIRRELLRETPTAAKQHPTTTFIATATTAEPTLPPLSSPLLTHIQLETFASWLSLSLAPPRYNTLNSNTPTALKQPQPTTTWLNTSTSFNSNSMALLYTFNNYLSRAVGYSRGISTMTITNSSGLMGMTALQ
jgi:hypothetical protein